MADQLDDLDLSSNILMALFFLGVAVLTAVGLAYIIYHIATQS